VISFHLPLAPRSSTPILVSFTKSICRDIVSHVRKIRQLLASTAALLPTYYDETCILVHLRGHSNDQSGKAKLISFFGTNGTAEPRVPFLVPIFRCLEDEKQGTNRL
jgi:hypothetical protein